MQIIKGFLAEDDLWAWFILIAEIVNLNPSHYILYKTSTMYSPILRKRHNTNLDLYSQQQSLQTSDEVEVGSMFNNFFSKNEEENYKKQNTLYNRLTHFQERKRNHFYTYPPKKKNLKKLQQQSKQRNNSLSTSNILNSSTLKNSSNMSSHNSPLRATNTGRFYIKRSVKRSFSESSAEKPNRYTTSDSSTNQDDNLVMSASDKRKMTRRSLSSGLQNHKYSHHLIQHSSLRPSQSLNGDHDGYSRIFGEHSQYVSDMIDIGIRVVLVVVFSKLETQTAFKRIIHSEEMWMYKNPRTKDFVSPLVLLIAVIFGPFCITLIHLGLTRDRRDFRAASWAWTLILGLNGLFTSLLKISVGRPRPDFYYRCFPDGVMQLSQNGSSGVDNMLDLFNCTGNIRDINEGRKSFPSGHSSFAFAGFGFITYYVGAKLHAFNHRGRGESWRLFVSLTPLVLASLVAVSRTCDYHHHWEDVTIGSLIGLFVSYYIYRQYYPSIFSSLCHRAYSRDGPLSLKTKHEHTIQPRNRRRLHSYKRVPSEECGEASLLCESRADEASVENDKRPLLNEQKPENKWF